MSEIHVVTVGHPYEIQVFPHEGNGKISGFTKSFRTYSEVALTEAHPEDAPVAISLAFGSTRFDVRHFAGSFYRPLLSPTHLARMDLDEFTQLALGDKPWRDNPFLGAFSRQHADSNHERKAFLKDVEEFAGFHYRKVAESKLTEARGNVQVAAADLLLVDGVMYRTCPEPTLVLKSGIPGHGAKGGYRVTWRIDGINGQRGNSSDVSCLPVEGDDDVYGPTTIDREPKQPHGYSHRRPTYGVPKTDDELRGDRHKFGAAWRRFAITDLESAETVAKAVASFSGSPFIPTQSELVYVDRPDTLSPGPRAPSIGQVAKLGFNEVNGAVRDMSRDSVLDWLDARDSVVAQPELALEYVAKILARPADAAKLRWQETKLTKDSYSHSFSYQDADSKDSEAALGSLVRYVEVERHRPQLAADDLAALVDLAQEEEEASYKPF